MRFLRVAALLAGFAATLAAVSRLDAVSADVRPEQMNDALPLWLGGWALRAGQDPQSPDAQKAQALAHPTGTQPGGYFNPYPPTASLLAAPATLLPWKTFAARWTLLGCVSAAVVGALGALAGRLRDPWVGVGGAAVVGAITATHPGIALYLRLGNMNLLMLALLAGGLAALGQRRDRIAGALLLLGAGWKIAPAALVAPALLARRWQPAVIVAVGLAAAAAVVLFVYQAPVGFAAWWEELRRTAGFYWKGFEVDVVGRSWRRPAFVLTLALTSGVAWRRHAMIEGAVFGVALLGMLSVYSPFPHEGVLVLPALGAILGAPLRRGWLPLDVALVLLVGGLYAWAWPTSAEQDHDPVRWVAFGWTLWGAAGLRYVLAAARPRGPGTDALAPSNSSARGAAPGLGPR